MDELSSEAKSILTLAKQAAPKAEPGARERVRERVDAAVVAVAIAHGEPAMRSLAKLGNGKSFLTQTKIMLVSGALLIGGGSMLWSKRGHEVTPRERNAAAEVAPAEVPADGLAQARATTAAPPAVGDVRQRPLSSASPTPAAAQPGTRVTPKLAGEAHYALAAEMSLLSEATDALAQHDTKRARAALLQHKKRFRHAQLRGEREGLWLLVRCMEAPEQTREEASAFLSKSVASLLGPRVRNACGLTDSP